MGLFPGGWASGSQLPHIFQFGSDPFLPPGRNRQAPVRSTVGLFAQLRLNRPKEPWAKNLVSWWGPNPLPSAASTHKSKVSTGHHVPLGATLELELSTSPSLRIVDHPSQVSWLMGVVAGCSWADENCYQQES